MRIYKNRKLIKCKPKNKWKRWQCIINKCNYGKINKWWINNINNGNICSKCGHPNNPNNLHNSKNKRKKINQLRTRVQKMVVKVIPVKILISKLQFIWFWFRGNKKRKGESNDHHESKRRSMES